MLPYPIETAPKIERVRQPVLILLWCPDQGGWHTGIWLKGSWRLRADLERVLHPTHWLPAPPDVVEPEQGTSKERERKAPTVYSPATLAERWLCSAAHVRGLIRRGELQAFSFGKLTRISADAVEEYERRNTNGG